MVTTVQKRNSLGAAFKPTVQFVSVPPSVGGVNALDPLMGMPPEDCIYTYNLMPSEYGMELRKGYREWATGVGTSNTEVRTIIPYEGHDPDKDKLFAVTADGVYDVSLYNTDLPVQDVAFSDTSADAGYGVWAEMTLDNDNQVLFFADSRNGLYQYSEATELWSAPTYTGPDKTRICHVNLFKQRLWVVERGEAYAYYSQVDSVSGAMTKFTFGSKFRYGGELVGTWTWTFDGGAGVNDFLVAISRGGDVLVYQGSDPSLADFSLIGSWFVGEIPSSRRVVLENGGELYILSTMGLISLRDLIQGADLSVATSTAKKVNRILRTQVTAKKSTYGWSMRVHPPDGFLQIIQPYSGDQNALQYCQNLQTRAWGFWRGVPVKSADTWNGEYYIGGPDGKVYQYYGVTDGATLAGGAGVAISFSCLNSFQAYGNHGTYKQVGMMRVIGLSAANVSYTMKAIYDYDIVATAPDPTAPQGSGSGALWDVAKWDQAVWDTTLTGEAVTQGGQNIGRTAAIAMTGEATTRITVVGWDITVNEGTYL